jgi:polysaccharide deacetylase 2 family uncharacterized protein YibQ
MTRVAAGPTGLHATRGARPLTNPDAAPNVRPPIMSKKKNRDVALRRALLAFAGLAVVLFAAGECWRMATSDAGRLMLARHTGLGDHARVTQLVGRLVRRGIESAGVPRDSVRETVPDAGRAAVRVRIGLAPGASAMQTNYAITRAVEEGGGTVLEGRESLGEHGEPLVILLVGLPRRATHEIVLVRPGRPRPVAGAAAAAPEPVAARLALVLYGFGDEEVDAPAFFALPHPFAVAIVPGARSSEKLFRAARAAQREMVLHLPLEPVNYPQVDPGPGALLVTMDRARITGLVRRYLEAAGPVSAVANHMGSLATQDMQVMTAIYGELRRRGIPFVHVQAAAGSVCKSLASDQGVNYAEPDAVLDQEARARDTRSLDGRWKAVLERAREHGTAIVFVRATPRTLAWLPGALAPRRLAGTSLVPLESLLRKGATL